MQIRRFESARLSADLIWRGGSLLVASLRPVTVYMARIGKSSEFTRCRPRKKTHKLARAWKSVGSWTRVEYVNGELKTEREGGERPQKLESADSRFYAPLHTPEQIRRWYDTAWEHIDRAYTKYTYTRNLRGWKRRVFNCLALLRNTGYRWKKKEKKKKRKKTAFKFDILHFCSD